MDTILNVNTFDAVIIGLIILLSLKGLISGFTKELFGALGIIGGIFTATFFNKDVAQYVSENFTNSINIKILELLSLILIFLAIFLLMKLIYKIIATLSKDDYISPASRIAGMLIKMITLFFIFSLIVYSFSTKPQVTEKFKTTLNKSSLYPLLKSTGAVILNVSALTNETNSTNEKNSTKSGATSENNVSNKEKNTEENITKESVKEGKKDNTEKNISTEIKTDEKNDSNKSKVFENNNSDSEGNNIKTVIENNKTKSIDENISKNHENNESEIEKNNTLELNSTKK